MYFTLFWLFSFDYEHDRTFCTALVSSWSRPYSSTLHFGAEYCRLIVDELLLRGRGFLIEDGTLQVAVLHRVDPPNVYNGWITICDR